MNSFSAFKLFYDEMIYKKNSFVSYANVKEALESIRDNVDKVRKFSKVDVKKYMSNLNKVNKLIREDLNEIAKKNKSLMQYYYLMYKARMDNSNDKVEDMPFIISNSFYNDYRLDDKTIFELENNNNTIPKYTSLEKKEIREKASKTTAFEFFLALLKESEDCKKYSAFLEKANVVLNLYPLYNETHYLYFNRLESLTKGFDKFYSKVEEKAKTCDDYENISLKMKIAYKKKFDDWNLGLTEIVNEYFDYLFNKKENDSVIKEHFNIVNKISYSTYLEIVTDIKEEKERLEAMFNLGDFTPITYYGDTYLLRFREVLINSYFDKRFSEKPIPGDVDSYVNATINLYSLSVDLEDSLLDYYIYLASHSKRLLRNNDVESAIVSTLFDQYSPLKSLDRYEALRKEFAAALAKESNDFKKHYNTKLLDKRVEYGFKGTVPNKASINVLLNQMCKNFILEHCLDNIVNYDQTGLYDTRNYDLGVLCEKLSFDDIIELYASLKNVFSNFPDSMVIPQKFIVEVLYDRLLFEDTSVAARNDRLVSICKSYLKEEPLFI